LKEIYKNMKIKQGFAIAPRKFIGEYEKDSDSIKN
jgi:hypothetical protein